MKKITLTPVTVPLPRDISSEVRMSVAKAEEAMRKNNRIIEDALYKQSSEFVYDLEENIEDVNDELHDLESYVSGMNSRIVPPELINMNNATPVLTYEFDNTASGYAKIFSRDNSSVTNIWDVRDEVAFRITVSGTGIDAVYDVYVKFKGVLIAQPDVWVYAKTRDIHSAIGITFGDFFKLFHRGNIFVITVISINHRIHRWVTSHINKSKIIFSK